MFYIFDLYTQDNNFTRGQGTQYNINTIILYLKLKTLVGRGRSSNEKGGLEQFSNFKYI